jgi:hypothetical protein
MPAFEGKTFSRQTERRALSDFKARSEACTQRTTGGLVANHLCYSTNGHDLSCDDGRTYYHQRHTHGEATLR